MNFKYEFRPTPGESAESMEARVLEVLDQMDRLPEPTNVSYLLIEQVEHPDGSASFGLKMDYTPRDR
jgi:hypothetical protein